MYWVSVIRLTVTTGKLKSQDASWLTQGKEYPEDHK
jgi:hypothetical protein